MFWENIKCSSVSSKFSASPIIQVKPFASYLFPANTLVINNANTKKWRRGVVVKLANLLHRGCQFDSYMFHFKKTLLVSKATGNHLMNSNSLEKTQLEMEHGM